MVMKPSKSHRSPSVSVTINLSPGVDLVLEDQQATRIKQQLAHLGEPATRSVLDDEHPSWDRHSGGAGHDWPEWGTGDEALAEAFYGSLKGKAKLFLDLLLDSPGIQLDVDDLIAESRGTFSSSFSVAGAINGLRLPHGASGRRYPFYWWEGTPSRYAVKPSVAALFNGARAKVAS
jgi:hypothetical protein